MSDLTQLFQKDPLHYSEQDLNAIVKRMREAQAQFELGARAPVAERNTPAKAAKKSTVDLLKDLGL